MGSLLSLHLPKAPAAVSKATQTEWDCPLCRSVQSDAAAVPCGHRFCLGCLLRHTAAGNACPLCASPVLSARFSALSPSDFLQCILSPAGAPPGPASWPRRALFRLVRTGPRGAAPAPPEPAGQEELPAELWAELLRGHERLLEPVRPWLRHSLDTIYGPQWWEARQVETIALATLCVCGPDRAELTRMLHTYLGDYTAPLVHGLVQVTVHGCRDAWLQSQPAPEAQRDEAQSPAAGPSSPAGTPALGPAAGPAAPGLGARRSQPEPGGSGRPLALPAPAGHDQHRAWTEPDQPWPRSEPEQHRAWAELDQHRAWAEPEEHRPRSEPGQHRAWAEPGEHLAWAEPEQNRPRSEPDQHRAWAGPDQPWPRSEPEQHRPRSEPEQPRARAGPQEDAPAPGPSAPRRPRRRRPRASRHSQGRRAYRCRLPLRARRRKPRRK